MIFQVIIGVCDQHGEQQTPPQLQNVPVWQNRHLTKSICNVGVITVSRSFFPQSRTGRNIWQTTTFAAIKAIDEPHGMPAGRQFKSGLRCSNTYRARHIESRDFQPLNGPCIID